MPASAFAQKMVEVDELLRRTDAARNGRPRRFEALSSARSGSVEPFERSKIASASSSISVGETASIFR